MGRGLGGTGAPTAMNQLWGGPACKRLRTPALNKETDDEIEDQSEVTKRDELRRSVRERIPTEKMLAYQREESEKAERKLMNAYEEWKAEARKARGQLKTDIPESQLATLIDTLENERDTVMNAYIRVRSYATPPTDTRRRIDACDAVTKDIVRIAYERISGVDGYFDSERVRGHLRELLDRDCARSIYGSTVSCISSKVEYAHKSTFTELGPDG